MVRRFVRESFGLRGTLGLHRAAFGLDLLRALNEDPGLGARITADLRETPAQSAEEEMARLQAYAGRRPRSATDAATGPEPNPAMERETTGSAPSSAASPAPASPPEPTEGSDPEALSRQLSAAAPAVRAHYDAATGRIELTGTGVDSRLYSALKDWLKTR